MRFNKIITSLMLSVSLSVCRAQIATPNLLEDGFAIGLDGIEGILKDVNDGQFWYFELDSDLSDEKATVKAGTSLQLLPSSTLEKITADANSRSTNNYRLRGIITQYQGRNYLFPSYFEAIRSTNTEPAVPAETQTPEVITEQPQVIDSNDVIIPPEIMERFLANRAEAESRAQRIVDSNTTAPENTLRATEDSILLEKTAEFIETNGEYKFHLDFMGRDFSQVSLTLLPCAALEQAELQRHAALERIRFNISGIVTKYKGKDYLLLYKATRLYSYGNFG